jgi:autotransporter-associated beta strand protein
MATRQWAVTTNGTFDFNNPANWAFGVAPSAFDIAQFGANVTDTITGNGTIAEIAVTAGSYSLAGTYAISGAQPTELSIATSGIASLTILPGALVDGGQAVTLSGLGATLLVEGGLAASSLSIGNGNLAVSPGAYLAIAGPISMTDQGLVRGQPLTGQSAGPAIAINNAIQTSGTVIFESFGQQEIDFNGVISGSGLLDLTGDIHPGTIALNGSNTFSGGVQFGIANLTVAVGNANGLGTGKLTITGSELLATTTETIANQLSLGGNFTIAAAHGQTLTIGVGNWSLNPGGTVTFGAPGQDGTVVFDDTGGAALTSNSYGVSVQAGTLKAGDLGLAFLVNNASSVVVGAGATLDAAGFSGLSLNALQGGGQVTDSGAAAPLALAGAGNFSGIISGPYVVTIVNGATTLSGANTYTGGTTINSGATLTLGSGGASGSVAGAIANNGALVVNRSDTFTLNNVAGSGSVTQSGPGSTILGSGVAYSGGTTINAGTLAVGSASALGAGAVTIAGGELLATSTETIADQLKMSGNFTIAAAHGQTLTTASASNWSLNASAGEIINFGAAGQDGVVVFKQASVETISGIGAYTVNVQAGTLQAADSGLGFLLGNDLATVVQVGATLDLAGSGLQVNGLQGGGHIGDSGAVATLAVGGGAFSGTIDGALALLISPGALTLTGTNTFTGGTTIGGGATLTLGNGGSITGNILDGGVLEFHLSGTLIENGVISGGGQVVQDGSGVTVLTQTNSYSGGTFLDGGTLELQQLGSAGTGAITFLSVAASRLQIDGAAMPSNQIIGFAAGDQIYLSGVSASGWSYSGGVLTLLNGATTVAQMNLSNPFTHPDFGVITDGTSNTIISLEAPPRDFRGNGFSDLLWQNTDGTPAVWLMNGASPVFATNLTNPGASWRLVGTGDFNGDVKSDLVWQNSDGTPAIWLMSGATQIFGSNLPNPGASWHLIGTGDLNGDGRSDFVWQNTDGTPAIWLMNGATEIAGGNLQNPGPSWHLVGTGDFNGDGKADLVWQNTDGTPAIWLMNGLTQIGGGNLPNPGASWRLVGTGDFNGDGKSDILWQNSDGTPAIWLMNGATEIAGGNLPNPGSSWHVIGTGDFNADGKSDILWQNSDGTPAVWLMNGMSQIFGANLIDPGASWHLVTGH